MGDDYQYQVQPLPENKKYGGNASTDAELTVTNPDVYPVASTSLQNEFPIPDPYIPGTAGGLPEGVFGDLLVNNGSNWVRLPLPNPQVASLLAVRVDALPYWILPGGTGNQNNDIIYYSSSEGKYVVKEGPPPSDSTTYVLGIVNNVLTWMDTEDC